MNVQKECLQQEVLKLFKISLDGLKMVITQNTHKITNIQTTIAFKIDKKQFLFL